MRGVAAVALASTGVPMHWVPQFEARGIVVARSFSCSGGSLTLGISRPCNSTLAAFMAVVQGDAVLGPVQGGLPALWRAGRPLWLLRSERWLMCLEETQKRSDPLDCGHLWPL